MQEYWDRFCQGVGGEGGVDLRGFDASIEGLRAGGVRESVNRNRGFLDDGRTYYDKTKEMFTKPYDFKFCKDMVVGQTYEVHWPSSAAGRYMQVHAGTCRRTR